MPRDIIISIIDLARTLNLPASENMSKDMYIVTNFNNLHTAFHVHSVEGIHRVSWTDIVKPDATINTNGNGVATGIIRFEDKLIIILDFEKIVSDISPETGLKLSDMDKMGNRARNNLSLLIAEDSPLLNKLICDCLHKAGYSNVEVTNNGQEAWQKLNEYKEKGKLNEKVSCVITDIEMPQMDGHHLLKLIRDDSELVDLPVVIFSSLINDQMRRKGELLGATAQLTKPEIGMLVDTLDNILSIK